MKRKNMIIFNTTYDAKTGKFIGGECITPRGIYESDNFNEHVKNAQLVGKYHNLTDAEFFKTRGENG